MMRYMVYVPTKPEIFILQELQLIPTVLHQKAVSNQNLEGIPMLFWQNSTEAEPCNGVPILEIQVQKMELQLR